MPPATSGAGRRCCCAMWLALSFKTGPDSVDHYDLSRLINVLVTPVGNDLGHVAKDIEQVLADHHSCRKT